MDSLKEFETYSICIQKLMKEKNVSLLPGKRSKWKETLEKELCIEVTSYEKKWWVKIKQNDLV